MALPAQEPFTGSGALSASWTNVYNSCVRSGDQGADGAVNDLCYARWTADAFDADQYAQQVIKSVTDSLHFAGLVIRSTGTSGGTNFAGYFLSTDGSSGSGHTSYGYFSGNVGTTEGNLATTFPANSVMRMEVRGTGAATRVKFVKDGAQVGVDYTPGTTFDTGSPCFGGYDVTTATMRVDDFEAGDLVDSLDQEGFRFRNDDGTETTATWSGEQDAGVTAAKGANLRLRVLVNASGDMPATVPLYKYRKQGETDYRTLMP